MNKVALPENLMVHDFVILHMNRNTRRLTLALPDQQTYDLGPYMQQHSFRLEYGLSRSVAFGSASYLLKVLGGNESLTNQALSTAYSFGTALILIQQNRVCAVDKYSHEMIESAVTQEQLKTIEKKLRVDDDDVKHGMWIEPLSVNTRMVDKPRRSKRSRR